MYIINYQADRVYIWFRLHFRKIRGVQCFEQSCGVPSKDGCYQFKANYHNIYIFYLISNISTRTVFIQYTSKEKRGSKTFRHKNQLQRKVCRKEMLQKYCNIQELIDNLAKSRFSLGVFTFTINLSNSVNV